MRGLLLCALFLCFCATAQERFFSETLANGLSIYVVENHDQPQVYGAIAVRAGSKHDPSNATGMAHYLEHMLFKGTDVLGTINFNAEKPLLDSITILYDLLGSIKENYQREKIQQHINRLSLRAGEFAIANETDKLLSQIGSSGVNASTNFESTVYYNSFPAHEIEKWMSLYAERFYHPVFRLFQSELETVYEEKNRKSDDMGSSIFDFYMQQFFKHHPYGQQTVIGTTEHLKNPSLSKMYDYFNTYYVPENMALIICGDVNAVEVFSLTEKYFSKWIKKSSPVYPEYKEADFKGKEIIKIRRTPIKAGAIGYRLPSNKHQDMIAMRVVAALLSNAAESGKIDRLINDDKLLMAGMQYLSLNDAGAAFLFFVPKIIGQSLHKAEKLVSTCIQELQNGKFSNDDLESVKSTLLKANELDYENNASCAQQLINAFIQYKTPNEYFKELNAVKNVSREQVVEISKKYFGQNCLAMYSRMGFPKKDKIKKPSFKPVIPKNENESAFTAQWKYIQPKEIETRFIEPEEEIDSLNIDKNNLILRNNNPYNKIASITFTFGAGTHQFPISEYLDNYLMSCGTKSLTLNVLNQKLLRYACNLSFETSLNRFYIRINVPEENLDSVLQLVSKLLTEPALDKKAIEKIARAKKLIYRVDKRSADYLSKALNDYALFGEESSYLNHYNLKSFKKTNPKILLSILDSVLSYGMRVAYTGAKSIQEIEVSLRMSNFIRPRLPMKKLYIPKKKLALQNTVYILKKRNARQTQLYLLKQGSPYTLSQTPVINAFNKYFSGDMSSILFQEVREFRSLAYATFAQYQTPAIQNELSHFMVYSGTQSDKSMDCLSTLFHLVNQMPVKENRFATVQSALLQAAAAARPSFRQIIPSLINWQTKGFLIDPNAYNYAVYPHLTFNDIVQFYQVNIQSSPTTTCITGKTKNLKLQELNKYGKVKQLKIKNVIRL